MCAAAPRGRRSGDSVVLMTHTTPLAVPGTFNFRDAGGMLATGGRVRPGVLFRSDALNRLGEDGRSAIARLGIRTVIDLRDQFELEAMPDDTATLELDTIHLPVFEGSGASQSTLGSTLAGLYELILAKHADVVVAALRDIAHADGGVLVHCTAGKDRTGIVVALALLAVGADRDDVISNYAESEANLRGEWLEQMMAFIASNGGEDTPDLRVLLGGSPPEALAATLDWIDGRWGGVRDYLLAAGFSEMDIAALVSKLVEPS